MLHSHIVESRSKYLLKVPNYNLESYGKRAFSVAGPLLWNSLPMDIRSQNYVVTFMEKQKTFFYWELFLICNICTISFTFDFEFSALWALSWIQRYIRWFYYYLLLVIARKWSTDDRGYWRPHILVVLHCRCAETEVTRQESRRREDAPTDREMREMIGDLNDSDESSKMDLNQW